MVSTALALIPEKNHGTSRYAIALVGDPWERQANESSKAWEAFVLYRDMGTSRSIERVSKLREAKVVPWWPTRYRWRERIEAWEAEQDKVACAARQAMRRVRALEDAEREETIERGLSRLIQTQVDQHLRKRGIDPVTLTLSPEAAEGADPDVPLEDIRKLLDTVVKLQRSARGDVTEVVETREVKSWKEKIELAIERAE